MSKSVSVIMPSFNAESYISLAIESILNQSFSDFEFLIYDDGSTDSTVDIIRTYSKMDSRIKFFTDGRVGLVAALNKLLNLSSGKFIARMDADDISHHLRLARQVSFSKEEGLDIVGSHFRTISSSGVVLRLNQMPTMRPLLDLHISMGPPFAHGSVMMLKDFLTRNGIRYGWHGVYSEDFELWQRMYRYGARFGNVDELLYDYRDHGVSLLKVKHNAYSSTASLLRRQHIKEHQQLLLAAMEEVLKEPHNIPFESHKLIPSLILKFAWVSLSLKVLLFLRRTRLDLNVLALLRFVRGQY